MTQSIMHMYEEINVSFFVHVLWNVQQFILFLVPIYLDIL